MTDKPKLFHPCKETCSGYKQGYEDGMHDCKIALAPKAVMNSMYEQYLKCRCGLIDFSGADFVVYGGIRHSAGGPCYTEQEFEIVDAGNLRPEGQ